MTVEHVVLLVEERSMEAALRELLPKILGATTFDIHAHQGKLDLLAKLEGKLRGYAAWLPPTYRIVVLVDRDNDDCTHLKTRLEEISRNCGLATRSTAGDKPWSVTHRIAIEELEAWYFGDWDAVRASYARVSSSVANQAAYRRPDEIAGGTWEALERVLQHAGYFASGLRKIEAARSIGAHMDPARNTSPSFRALREVLHDMRAV